MGSVVEKESIQTHSTVHQPDDMESEAVTDHAGSAGMFCRLQVAGCRMKFNYNWKTAGS